MFKSQSTYRSGLIFICSVWALGIAILTAAHLFSSHNGFLWPMGQDIDWSLILKQGTGALAAEQEFGIDYRNPLSGWFYSLVSPLILDFQYGFHFLHLVCSLILGISVYTLIRQFCSGRASSFSIMTGLIVAIWWFWSNYSQVVSLMLFALALSILAVWSYCVYVDSDRKQGIYYGWSISLWLLALGIYTIQCGAIFPIFLIAMFRGKSRGIRTAIRDISSYLLTGAVFMGIWMATANLFFKAPVIKNTTHIHISFEQLIQSAKYFIWHPSFSIYLNSALAYWSKLFIVCIVISFSMITFFIMRSTVDNKDYKSANFREGALWTLITALGLAIPTLILEATSSIWAPGLRSDMMFAAFIPMFFLSAIALLGSFVATERIMIRIIFVSASIMGSTVILLNAEQNKQGFSSMQWQRNLVAGLAPLQEARADNLHFIVINESGVDYVGYLYSNRLVQDKLGRVPLRWTNQSVITNLSLRLIETVPRPSTYSGAWRVHFGPEGVKGALPESSLVVPYSSIKVVRYDGKTVTPLNEIRAQDLVGLQADFEGEKTIMLS